MDRPSSGYVELCNLRDLPDGDARGFDPFDSGTDSLFVVRNGEALRAFRNVCPHQGASLPWCKDAYLNADGDRIVCSAHGAQFDVNTGRCTQGAALGQSLDSIDIELTELGSIRVQVVDLR